jgi:hypothetical protein
MYIEIPHKKYANLINALREAKILADLVSEYDLLDTTDLSYSPSDVLLADRVSRAWQAKDKIDKVFEELLEWSNSNQVRNYAEKNNRIGFDDAMGIDGSNGCVSQSSCND